MTKEKMTEILYYALGKMSEKPEMIVNDVRANNGKINSSLDCMPEYHIASVIYELETEITKEACKKSGKTKLLSACKNVLKSASETKPPFFKNAFYVNNNGKMYQCFLDGYRLIALTENSFLNLQTSSPEETIVNGNDKLCKLCIDMINAIDMDYSESLKLPDINELKAEIRRIKATYKAELKYDRVVVVIDDIAMYNAEFLLDSMNAIDTDVILHKGTKNGTVKSVSALKDNNGNIAFTMPINLEKGKIIKPNLTIIVQDGKIIK